MNWRLYTIETNTKLVYKKYLKYTVIEMLEDRDFPVWLKHLSENQELNSLIDQNPSFARKISQAREIIRLISPKEEPVRQDDILLVWERVTEFELANRSALRRRRYLGFFRYAAILVLALLLTSVAYWRLTKEDAFEWSAFRSDQAVQQSRLILSSGEEIVLKKDESIVKVSAHNQAIKINNDSIISLTGTGKGSHETAMNRVVVPFGKKSRVELADGTRVFLNAGSKMAFPVHFNGTKREVFLEGEAYFEVAPDKSLPFYVKTKDIVIRVLGTKFNVTGYEMDQEVTTVLLEGSISLKENSEVNIFGKEVVLSPSQRASFNKLNLTTTVSDDIHADLAIAWTEGWFPFSREPLSNVLKKVERYYNVRVEYVGHSATDDLISGKLDLKDSLDGVMRVLADVAKLTYRIDQNTIFVEINHELPMKN